MKKSYVKLYFLEFLMLVCLLLDIFVINIKSTYLISLVIGVFLAAVILLLGFEKSRYRYRKDVLLNVVIYTVGYQIITYIMGIFLGFVKNGYSLTITNIVLNTLPVILVIVVSELLRYAINTKSKENKMLLVISFVIFVLIDVALNIHLYDIHVGKDVVELICNVIFPSMAQNILFTYVSLKVGYESNIVYRLVMGIPTYFMPIFPNINIYLTSVFTFVLPIVLFYVTYRGLKTRDPTGDVRQKHRMSKVVMVISFVFLIVVVSLTSGVLPVYILAVGSGSMEPNINKGDAVIVKKIDKERRNIKNLKKGDILVYEYADKVIVHRIHEINEVNGSYTFKTKGDNNDEPDGWVVDEEKVIGTAELRILWIGYPTVWLNENLN